MTVREAYLLHVTHLSAEVGLPSGTRVFRSRHPVVRTWRCCTWCSAELTRLPTPPGYSGAVLFVHDSGCPAMDIVRRAA